jgi:putative oxidoreductase
MATLSQQNTHYHFEKEIHRTKNILWVVPWARFFFSLIFILSGFNHFTSGSISYADSMGIPMADILVPISGLIILMGGMSILLGLHAKFGALLILIFLIAVTLTMHRFWNIEDPQEAQMQMIHFLKNLSLIGGALLFIFYGAGPHSIDLGRAKKKFR